MVVVCFKISQNLPAATEENHEVSDYLKSGPRIEHGTSRLLKEARPSKIAITDSLNYSMNRILFNDIISTA